MNVVRKWHWARKENGSTDVHPVQRRAVDNNHHKFAPHLFSAFLIPIISKLCFGCCPLKKHHPSPDGACYQSGEDGSRTHDLLTASQAL